MLYPTFCIKIIHVLDLIRSNQIGVHNVAGHLFLEDVSIKGQLAELISVQFYLCNLGLERMANISLNPLATVILRAFTKATVILRAFTKATVILRAFTKATVILRAYTKATVILRAFTKAHQKG
jgi:hypothetical protein